VDLSGNLATMGSLFCGTEIEHPNDNEASSRAGPNIVGKTFINGRILRLELPATQINSTELQQNSYRESRQGAY
jgi:hypothetical protein